MECDQNGMWSKWNVPFWNVFFFERALLKLLNTKNSYQGCHGRFLAGKDAIVVAISPLPFSISQNPAKDQVLAALHPVAALP